MRVPQKTRRGGFTLLEVVLALTIGILLMSALYVAVDIQLRHAQAGRDIVERSTLVRSLMTRIAADISKSVGVSTPVLQSQGSMSGQAGGMSGSSGTGSSGGNSGSGSTSGSSGSASASGSGSGSTSGSSSTASAGTTAVINLGIQGDSAHLIISGSIVPREFVLGGQSANNNATSLPLSDLRWICYWVAGSGLARQETSTVTGQDPSTIIPSDSDAAGLIIAEEVKSVQFSYFDGSNWQDSWTGTTPGPDGSTPMGAPVAVAVVIGMGQPGTSDLKYYRRVVAIPTTNQAPAVSTAASTGG